MNEKIDQAIKLLEEWIQEDNKNNAVTLIVTQNLSDTDINLRVLCQGKSEMVKTGLLGAVTQDDKLTNIFTDVVTEILMNFDENNSSKTDKPIYLN